MKVYEVTSAVQKPLTPDQARIKSMKDQVKRAQQNVKAEKARQMIKAGQQQLKAIWQLKIAQYKDNYFIGKTKFNA